MEDLSMIQDARLKKFMIDSNDALEFRLIRCIEDLDSEEIIFKPEMSHQVFGSMETIFGYRDLKVQLFYAAGCLETFLGMTYTEKANDLDFEGVEPDKVLTKMAEKLAPNVHYSLDTFVNALKKDDTFKPEGELLHSFTINDNGTSRQFEVYKADINSKKFKEYHQRVQTFLLWYIDAANFIDVDDEQWSYFNMFEKYTTSMGVSRYGTVGFVTVYRYYAYPEHIRPRIAQVLILPPFRQMGLGTQLLQAIYRQYVGMNEVKDITVEDPSVTFQRIRNYVDAVNCSTLPSFKREHLMQGFNNQMAIEAREKFKINKKQARTVYEILRLRATNIANEEEYRAYRLDVKGRLNIPYKRKENEEKKLERALMYVDKRANPLPPLEQRIQLLDKEYRFLEEEYKRVIQRLEDAPEL
ncbi:histone acetyltransferase type B catalytic subunit [Odontomachus brunneus]|uniref:histone acetyltransferase type B catalytic subunit n=1 Tax=Odontomachus brunneus TaxID=486640 RepID=UPI0013F19805|nr:histone acetyltransferase type B catalytic subunit [Odontomachus brunneus]XP_032673415.1 histone acetyltransferase type B catalytic subunit [Odontomachus brunneus]XP_032673416.1 histone acetyltransferase type B catalytic subunit [Odontomachus brunneus]